MARPVEVDDSGLEEASPEYRAVAMRMRRLLAFLGMTQEAFAEATKDENGEGLRRTELSVAVNGKQLATSTRWVASVARAAKVDLATATDYLRGRIDLDGLEQRRAGGAPIGPVGGSDDLSPNKRSALDYFDWTGVEPAEYEHVHHALAKEHFASGIDAAPNYWVSRIRRILQELRETQPKTARRAPVEPPPSADEESPELVAHRRERAAAKTKKKSARR